MDSLDDFVKSLQKLGFTLHESRAYIALVSNGVSSAPEVAKFGNIPKSKVYDVLTSLVWKRVVEEFPGQPKKYRARAPQHVLSELIDGKKDEVNSLSKDVESMKNKLGKLLETKEQKYVDKDDLLWTINGRKSFHEKFVELGKKAKKEVLVITPYFSRNSLLEGSIEDAIARGVRMKALTTVNEDNESRVIYYTKLFHEIRNFPGELPITVVIIDKRECIYRMTCKIDGQPNYIGVYSRNEGLVRAFIQYWKGLESDSRPIILKKSGNTEKIITSLVTI